MRLSGAIGLLLIAATLAGCTEDDDPVPVGPDPVAEAPPPSYDASLEPAAAVMAVVPRDATTLEVTDFDQVRLQLGFGDMSSASPAGARREFWRRADEESPLLSPGMLRDPAARYEQRFGFTQDDVSWEAHFSGPSGDGYVVKFRDDLEMRGVVRAAGKRKGPLRGATVVSAAHLAAVGATREPAQSWAADPSLLALVGPIAGATYVAMDCLAFETAFGEGVEDDLAASPAADLATLDELGAFSVTFGAELATARLGPLRSDVFERARLAETMPATDPEFGLGYADPVADPQGGRIGFSLGAAPVAARLAHEQQLPFAVCAG